MGGGKEERDSSQKMDGSGIATHTLHIFQGLDPLGALGVS
jgi:hypothetical protein